MKQVLAFLSFIVLMIASTIPANAAKKCADFRTQAQAQAHYKSLKRANKTGWKSLDRNKDGVACECLKKKTCRKGKKKGVFGKKSKSATSKASRSASTKKSVKAKSIKAKSMRAKSKRNSMKAKKNSRKDIRKKLKKRKAKKSSK